jgi:hypothetical protein
MKSSRAAQELQRKIVLSGLRLVSHFDRADISEQVVVSAASYNLLQGVVLEVPRNMFETATAVLYDIFEQNKYGIHSVTIGGNTRLSEHIAPSWWIESFLAEREPLIAREVGS